MYREGMYQSENIIELKLENTLEYTLLEVSTDCKDFEKNWTISELKYGENKDIKVLLSPECKSLRFIHNTL